MTLATTGEGIVGKLAQLQNLVKRDPAAYEDEFKLQYRHFLAELDIFRLQPSADSEPFKELVRFLAHVAPCYPAHLGGYPALLMGLLKDAAVMDPDVRITVVQSLILLRNRGLVDAVPLLKQFFELFRVRDKLLRVLVFSHIVADIRNVNKRGRNDGVNRAIQTFMFTMLKDENVTAAKKSLDVMISLYRKRVWTDARTVNVIATALVSPAPKLCVAAMRFFLEIDDVFDDSDDDENAAAAKDGATPGEHMHSKKTRKRLRLADKAVARAKKMKGRAAAGGDGGKPTAFPAISLLNDPQSTAEKMFRALRSTTMRFEVRLMMMNVVSRLVGQHQLLLLNFYTFAQRYLTSHQMHVTQVLAYIVQACHPLVPPSELFIVVRAIANNFVADRCSDEVIQVGLNAIREICARVPLIFEEEGAEDLVQDLVEYRKYRDKGVMMAARSLLNAVREAHPALLRRRDRGREGAIAASSELEARPTAYGAAAPLTEIPGARLLEESGEAGGGGSDDGEEWEAAGADAKMEEDAEAGWVTVEHSDEEEEEDGSDGGEGEGDDAEVRAGLGAGGGGSDEDEDMDGDDGDEEEEDGESDDDGSEGEEGASGDDDDGASDMESEEGSAVGAAAGGGGGGGGGIAAAAAATAGGAGGDDGPGVEPVAGKKRKRVAFVPDSAADVPRERPLESRHILTPRDFERIAALQHGPAPKRLRRRGGASDDGSATMTASSRGLVFPKGMIVDAVVKVGAEDLESSMMRKKRVLDERLEQARSAADAKKQGVKKPGGSTNREKKRLKNFMMVRKSSEVQKKMKMSLMAKAKGLKTHLSKLERTPLKHMTRRRKM